MCGTAIFPGETTRYGSETNINVDLPLTDESFRTALTKRGTHLKRNVGSGLYQLETSLLLSLSLARSLRASGGLPVISHTNLCVS